MPASLTVRLWYKDKLVSDMSKEEQQALARHINTNAMRVLGYEKAPVKAATSTRASN